MIPAAALADPHVLVAAVVIVAGIVARSWFSLRKLATREKFRTSRFERALQDSRPQDRPEIIRALSTLEEEPASETGTRGDLASVEPAGRLPVGGRQRRWRTPSWTKDD